MKTLKLLKKHEHLLDRNAFSITNNKFIVNTYNSKYCKTNISYSVNWM